MKPLSLGKLRLHECMVLEVRRVVVVVVVPHILHLKKYIRWTGSRAFTPTTIF